MANIKSRSKELLKRIIDDGYYVSILNRVADRHNITLTMYALDDMEDEFIINFWNDFWYALPDGPEIRIGPFFELCDLCEEIYE